MTSTSKALKLIAQALAARRRLKSQSSKPKSRKSPARSKDKNVDGLTFHQWLRAIGILDTSAEETNNVLRRSWLRGDDPRFY